MHAGSKSQKSKYDGMQILGNLPPIVTKRQNEPFLPHTQTGSLLSSLSQPSRSFHSSAYSAPTISVRAPSPSQPHSQHPPPQPSEMPTILTTALRTTLSMGRNRGKGIPSAEGNAITSPSGSISGLGKEFPCLRRCVLLAVFGDQPDRGQSGARRTDMWERAE